MKPICWKRFDVRFSVGEIDSLIEELNEQFQYADHAGQPINRELLRAYDKLVWRRNYVGGRNVANPLQAQNKATPQKRRLGGADI